MSKVSLSSKFKEYKSTCKNIKEKNKINAVFSKGEKFAKMVRLHCFVEKKNCLCN